MKTLLTASDIDTVLVDSLKALDPNRPIREADIDTARSFGDGLAMGFNKRKMEDERRHAAEKEAAGRRATDAA